ncbi:Hpt domain-containing protein [Vibrio sp. ED004]|uniref:Hpt domain-containing protein n=1 Tax=unclassified Vibrio TaxID=2614977 RepID=UPI00036CFB3A|nr:MULTISPECIES: Hpt domain-containing protein [unclassified Vibrio]UPR58478.1 Hpt domain-containing protein [Vibrio sp. ED004]
MENKLNIGHEINWLSNYPDDQRSYLAEVYVSVMNEDLEQLKSARPEGTTTLQVIHRMKGGLSSIGHFSLEQQIKAEETALKLRNNSIEETNLNIIKLISHSVNLVEEWLEIHNVGN